MPLFIRALDAVTLLLLALTAWTLVTDDVRAGIFGLVPRVSVMILVYALGAFLLVRHIAQPSPSAAARWREGWRHLSDAPLWGPAVRVFLATRLMVLIVAFFAVVTFGLGTPGFVVAPDVMTNLPARFDAGYYADIALRGYDRGRVFDRQRNIAFFPAMPMLMRLVAPAFGTKDPEARRDSRTARVLWGGTVVSLAAFLFALWYLMRLGTVLLDPERAASAVLLLACYPFACFFNAPYTESLFLLGSIAAGYHLHMRQFIRAAVWGLIVGLTRPNGFMLCVPLALLALQQWRAAVVSGDTAASRRSFPALAAATAPVVGMLAFTAYLFTHTGAWFAWSRNHAAWGRTFGTEPLQQGYAWLRDEGLVSVVTGVPFDALNSAAGLFALVMIWPVYRRVGFAWAVFVAITILPPIFFGGALSLGRITSTLFPIFLALAAMLPSRSVPSWAAAFALLQGLCAALFFTWRELF